MPTMISFTGNPIDNKSQIRLVTCSSGRGPSRKRCIFSDTFPRTRFHGARSRSLILDAIDPRWINTACETSCPNSRGVTPLTEASKLITPSGRPSTYYVCSCMMTWSLSRIRRSLSSTNTTTSACEVTLLATATVPIMRFTMLSTCLGNPEIQYLLAVSSAMI